MGKPNIFKISHRIALEDKLTSSLAYLFNKYPDVGQAYLDRICKLTNHKSTQFIGAVDHPDDYGKVNKPDFLIRGKAFDILFEHKIDSDLGNEQLQRYLSLAKPKNQKLCFISNYLTEIPPAVTQSPNYLRGPDREHLVWSDFYEFFGGFQHELVREFYEWISDLGMNPSVWKGHGDPFADKIASEEFKSCVRDLKKLIDDKMGKLDGRMVKKGPVNPCFEIRKALPQVHLVYVGLHKSGDYELDNHDLDHNIHGDQMEFCVIMKTPNLLRNGSGYLSSPIGDFAYFPLNHEMMTWNKNLFFARAYLFPVSNLLDADIEKTKSNLEIATIKVLDHLKKEVGR